MDAFKDYKVADLTEDIKNELINLEEKLLSEKKQNIVLVAYEKNE